MNRDEYLKFHEDFCNEARALSARKNNDYAGEGGAKPFANFERVEAMGICSTQQGFLVRMTDKMSRLATFASGGKLQVLDESALDTLRDVVNYAILLAAYITQESGRAADEAFDSFAARRADRLVVHPEPDGGSVTLKAPAEGVREAPRWRNPDYRAGDYVKHHNAFAPAPQATFTSDFGVAFSLPRGVSVQDLTPSTSVHGAYLVQDEDKIDLLVAAGWRRVPNSLYLVTVPPMVLGGIGVRA